MQQYDTSYIDFNAASQTTLNVDDWFPFPPLGAFARLRFYAHPAHVLHTHAVTMSLCLG